ncbi:MAG: ABC transporter substrate-binding protein [Acidisphaera sp.]|nr:ABC transporter substrate-binding protein [Acidisphaera sp.]
MLTAAALVPGHAHAQTPAPDKLTAVFSSALANSQYWSMFLVGVDKGFYRDHGIELEFLEGQGGGVTAQVIANGRADIGLGVSASSVINADAGGADLKMIGLDAPVAAIAVLSKPPRTLDKPSDLVGKTIGIPPGTSQALAWPGFLAANGIDPKSVTVVNVQLASMRAALLQGQVDGYLAFSISNLPLLKGLGVQDPHALLFSDFGLRLAPDSGEIVRDGLIRSRPDVLKRLLAAIDESFTFAFAHPEEAVQAGHRMYPNSIQPEVATAQLRLEAALFQANRHSGKPLMWMPPEDWAQQVVTLTKLGGVTGAKPPESYYTNDLLPEAR